MQGPMEGVKVVELGVWVAGPSASMILADWGADVLKVEPLGDGTNALMVSSPIDYSADVWAVKRPPPAIGEHTDELLASAGYDTAKLADLRRRGVIR